MTAIPKAWETRRPVDTVTLVFDRPPSVNALFRNAAGIGRVKSRAYKEWIATAFVQITAQRPGCVRGSYHLAIVAERSNARADLDNIIKATADILKAYGVIQDDIFCDSFEAAWRGRGTSMSVRVTSHPGSVAS
jgi:Holliday junction resolvase RusA-like endonuclease